MKGECSLEKYVPLEKQSKKAQAAHHKRRRGSWQGVKPVSRKAQSKKLYSRARQKQQSAAEYEKARTAPCGL